MKARWGRLAAGCLVMAMIGFIYGWSVFSAPLVEEFGWAPSALSFTFTLLMWAFCGGGIVGGRLVRRMGARPVIWLAAAMTLAAFASTALLARADAPWLLYLTYGILGGGGVGIGYTAAMGAVMAWFPDRAGLASGMMLLCYCLSTMVLSSAAAWLFGAVGWRPAFALLGVGTSAVVAAAAAFLSPPAAGDVVRGGAEGTGAPGGKAADPAPGAADAAEAPGAAAAASAPGAAPSPAGATTAAMLRTPAFWAYATWMVIVSCIGLAVIGSANQLAVAAGAAPAAAVAAVGALALCNGLGRLAMGVVFDALGTATCTLATSAVLAASVGLLAGAIVAGSVPVAFAGMVLAGLGAGGISVIGSSFTATAFGETHYAENLAVLNLALIPAALAGPLALSVPLTAGAGYLPGLAALAAAAALAAGVSLALRRLLRNS
ncbi:MFS transporter [Adlercreutzia faecimuris]|uniref:MFS transporter n=1 Tax=Adlercreutzia faecimuris TaxID=2897341 RepID=A0ABS9WHZ7_9ACTN|nr:MFS transporter [Adlercreutzia sp. JBNU-10]MCI2242489.1 MFS transporter [Adlercreutzia sp. JBNU-10]